MLVEALRRECKAEQRTNKESNGAYEKLKETAKRIERRNLTFQNVRGGAAEGRRPVRLKKEAHSLNESKQHERETKPTEPRERETRCFNCQETGHLARECSKKAKPATNPRTVGSLSARLSAASAHTVGMTVTQEPQRVQPFSSPLFGDKTMVQLEIFGRVWPGLLDTGSEISILPSKVLLQAKADGVDIDNEVAEYPIDNATQVCDASGSRMSFFTTVDVNIRERDGTCAVMNKMYVSKSGEDLVIIGTNVLPRLGYQLVRETERKGEHRSSSSANESPTQQRNCYAAVVAQRAYIAPGAVGWVRLNVCAEKQNWMLNTSVAMIHTGICRADEKGVVEIPVVNRTQEPAVFRTGEVVGTWEKEVEHWREAEVKDLPPGVVTLHTARDAAERLSKLRELLAGNPKDGQLKAEVVGSITKQDDSEWLSELRKDADYVELIKWIENQRWDEEVLLPRMGRRVKVMDFLIEEGDLKIALEDGSTVRVVPKSKRKQVFEEAHKGAYALKDKTAAAVATAIFQRWICENGRWPRQIHTDQGKEFVNNVIEELAAVAGIRVSTTKGYNSRENGVCERAIGTIKRMLKKKVEFADFWDVRLG
ncbi:zinc knuckle [Ancylostoma ceylanicum]|uniref:Zinc knuckle n=1 Tax=Ancylostoma ceylanicum TaxID=53326 RepID=A0A0D6LBR2_9BILA|nr:zinc knuckle [Ancylostoma ceylanicum]